MSSDHDWDAGNIVWWLLQAEPIILLGQVLHRHCVTKFFNARKGEVTRHDVLSEMALSC